MAIEAIKKKYPIRDENGQPSTYPTFASQVFNSAGEPLENKDGVMEGVTAGNAAKLGGVEAENYALKTDTAPDSEKLGGRDAKYYIQPRNLLDNSDFTNPVNQRGSESYSGSVYTIDRWRLWDATGSLVINDGSITVASHNLYQFLETFKANTVYTLAVKHVDGTLTVMSHTFEDGDPETYAIEFYDNRVRIAPGQYLWAALYEGEYTADTLPPYVSKGYGAELTECLRYYQRYSDLGAALLAWSTSTTSACIGFTVPVPMRAEPTVTLDTPTVLNASDGTSRTLASYEVLNYAASTSSIRIRIVATAAWTKGCGCYIGKLTLSADL